MLSPFTDQISDAAAERELRLSNNYDIEEKM
jgi:hypothetical protein